ncbi:polysaccharide biosynthesis tyrosine autokinase [Arthrobacter sp. UNC362MFTsu5.1]|uniref:polysaccharide biosynthesis tyrosine autokinase n=1 Tax=Arthrobacter sp. UNC362MFTsu5.1 TaxID=1449044 RepID=UPI0009DE83AE|nr:polysaccharide biosynthesis tyrosine autokinase [Arthrobacter sp. UNC362MFTsu5.1]
MDLRDYLHILRTNWVLIATFALLGTGIAGGASVLIKPTYTAETQLFVSIQSSGSVQELQQGNTFSQARVQSYVKTVATPVVLQPAIDSLGLPISAGDLSSRVKASSDLNTVLINISVTDGSAVQAAATAQAVADSLIKAVDTLERPKTGGSSPISLSVITPATAPTAPSAPNTKLNILLGLMAGLILGLGLSLLRSILDTRIKGEPDLRNVTDAPLLGRIAFEADAQKKPLLTQAAIQSPRAESFRQLRTNLQFANVAGHAKTFVVTSSLPGEGKSTTATNLAIALSEAGQSVCLVDADLRRPMVGEYLGLERNAGLTTALLGAADINDLLQPWGQDNLYVLTSGQIPPNPSELLGSEEMKILLSRLEQAFDTIVVDAPPLLPVTDAAVLSQHAGGVVVVVGAQKTRTQDLQKALETLNLVDAKVLGVVLNRLQMKSTDAYSYAYYSAEANQPSENFVGANSDARAARGILRQNSRGGTNHSIRPGTPVDRKFSGSNHDDDEALSVTREARTFPQGLNNH